MVNISSTFKAISAGWGHTCGILTNGTAYCWGDGYFGRLGNGGTDNKKNPFPVNLSEPFKAISTSWEHSCGILENGTAYCWGQGQGGKLGYGWIDNHYSPVMVNLSEPFKDISAGADHTCGILMNGSAYCWGSGSDGRLGNGGWEVEVNPVAVNNAPFLGKTSYFEQGTEINIANISSSITSSGQNWMLSCLANDGEMNSSWMNSTDTTIINSLPYISGNTTTPSNVYTYTDLNLSVTCNDNDQQDILTVYVQPYLNGWKDESEEAKTVSNGINTQVYNYGSGNFSKWDEIVFEFWCGDGYTNTSKYNTSTVTVLNSPPTTPFRNSPPDDSTVPSQANHTVLNCSGSTDADGDGITYYYFGDDTDGSTPLGANDTGTGYNWTGLSDNTVYYWKCLAGDGYGNSSETGVWNFLFDLLKEMNTTGARIDPSPTAYSNETLTGYCNVSDKDGKNISYYWEIYRDGELNRSRSEVFYADEAYEKGGSLPSSPFNGSLAGSDQLGYVNVSDDIRWTTEIADSKNEYDSQVFIFNMSGAGEYDGIEIVWEGFGRNMSGHYTNISVWNWTSSSWIGLDSIDFTENIDNQMKGLITSGFGDVINSSTGELAVLASSIYTLCTACDDYTLCNAAGCTWCASGMDWHCIGCTFECADNLSACDCDFCSYSPFIYAHGNGSYHKVSDFIGGAVSPDLEYTSYTDISDFTEVSEGKAKVKITEEIDETSYIDRIYLWIDGNRTIEIGTITGADKELLLHSDDNYLVMEEGDVHYIEFNVPDTFERIEFVAEGYYISHSPGQVTGGGPRNSINTDFVRVRLLHEQGTEFNVENVSSGLTRKGQNWTLSCKGTNGIIESKWLNGSDTFIVNSVPEITYNSTYPASVYTNTDINFNATCTDINIGDNLTLYVQPYLNGGKDESEGSKNVSNGTSTLVYTYGSGNFSKGDEIVFEFWCGDGNDNSSRFNSTEITVLNTNPVLTSVSGAIDPISGGSLQTITPSGQDDLDHEDIYLHCCNDTDNTCTPTAGNDVCNDGTFAYNYSGMYCNYNVPYINGNQFVRCRTYDGDGYSSTTANTSFIIDSTVPVVSYASPTPGHNSRQIANSVTVNVTVNDAFGSVDICTLQWEGANYSMTMYGSGGSVTCERTMSTNSGQDYTFRVYAADESGNTGAGAQRIFRENFEPIIGSVTVTPLEAYPRDDLYCNVSGIIENDGDSLVYHYKWYDNDSVLVFEETSSLLYSILRFGNTSKKDTWTCYAKADDWYENGTEVSDSVFILSPPPIARIIKTLTRANVTQNVFSMRREVKIWVYLTDEDGKDDITGILVNITDSLNVTKVQNALFHKINPPAGWLENEFGGGPVPDGYLYEYIYTIPMGSVWGTWTFNLTNFDIDNSKSYNTSTFAVSTISFQVKLVLNEMSSNIDISGIGTGDVNTVPTGYHPDPDHFFISSESGNVMAGMVFFNEYPGNVIFERTANDFTMGIDQNLPFSGIMLVFTEGGTDTIIKRMDMIEKGTFMGNLEPSFSYGLGEKHNLKVSLYQKDVDLIANKTVIGSGSYNIEMTHQGLVNGEPGITVRKI